MRSFNYAIIIPLVLLVFTGCGITLPFTQTLSYHYENKAKDLKTSNINSIEIKWVPPEFPDRIDVQGASGFAGSGWQARIPTGYALAARILQTLDRAIGIEPGSGRILTITVLEAKSKFRLSISTPGLSYGECIFKAKFHFNDISWSEEFNASVDDSSLAPTTTYRLEMAWDQIALKVGESVVSHLTKQ